MNEIFAHDWAILGDDRIRRWPSTDKTDLRTIRVTINTWIGTSIGAKHWKVRVEEKENQWWSEDRNAWVSLSCDTSSNGCSMEGEVLKEEHAIRLAKIYVGMICGPKRKGYLVVWSGPGRPTWGF